MGRDRSRDLTSGLMMMFMWSYARGDRGSHVVVVLYLLPTKYPYPALMRRLVFAIRWMAQE